MRHIIIPENDNKTAFSIFKIKMTFLVVRALPKGSDMGPIDTVFSTKGALRIPLTYDKHPIPSHSTKTERQKDRKTDGDANC